MPFHVDIRTPKETLHVRLAVYPRLHKPGVFVGLEVVEVPTPSFFPRSAPLEEYIRQLNKQNDDLMKRIYGDFYE